MTYKKSFTLIETIVVIAVIGITLPVLFTVILTLMRQQVKIYRLSQIKREGDYLISIIENSIRDSAVSIYSGIPDDTNVICRDIGTSDVSATQLYFLDKSKQWFGYLSIQNQVASDSASQTPSLNSNKTIISNFSIYCSRNSTYAAPSVLFSFDICYDTGTGTCDSTRPEEIASLHYQSRVKLRNY